MLKQFHPLDWASLVKDFAYCVHDKIFDKMPYKQWREFDSVLTDYDIENVRVYWRETDTFHTMSVYFDTADGKTLPPFGFDSKDNSFGSFLYENFLYGEDARMKVKDRYYTDPDDGQVWQTYEPDATISGHYNRDPHEILKNIGSIGLICSDESDVTLYDAVSVKADVSDLNKVKEEVDNLVAKINATTPMNTTNNNKKENNVMKFNFDFGPVNSSMVRMSLYGLAVKNKAGTWVSYDAKAGDIMDVDILNFDGAKFLYKMPVAIKDISIGDVVIHNGIPMFVIAIATNGSYITAVDPINGERKDIMLPKSPFGFNFATKVVNFLGNTFNTSATADNPFGNMWMLMAMSGENKDMNDILPFLVMNNATAGIDNNVLMFMALSDSKSGSKDMLPWLLMMNTQNSTVATPVHTCACGNHCAANHDGVDVAIGNRSQG